MARFLREGRARLAVFDQRTAGARKIFAARTRGPLDGGARIPRSARASNAAARSDLTAARKPR